MSRPTQFDSKLADIMLEQLSEGKSLRKVCEPANMPLLRTVFKWLREDEEFNQQYARAKQESADSLADEIVDIADDKSGDPARDRLRVDSRKWIASKLKPKKYGEKLDMTSDGEKVDIVVYKPEKRTQAVDMEQEPEADS